MSADALTRIRDVIQEDAGGRGLRTNPESNLVTACAGDFAAACRSLAGADRARLAIITGFYIPHATPPAAETDGPLGAVFLARALVPLGVGVVLSSDPCCAPALEAGLKACGLEGSVPVVWVPPEQGPDALDYWEVFDPGGHSFTHLLALERVGPSHTPESVRAQPGATAEGLVRFLREVPPDHYDRCHNMRGNDITRMTRPAHLLFERAREWDRGLVTLGVGDGGNEIGMGKVPWEVLRRNVPDGGLTASRVPVDHLIVTGVSNWGAYGLAAGVRLLRGAPPDPDLFDPDRQRALLELMVEQGPLVDGMTGRQVAQVDGLPFEREAEVLRRLGEIVAGR
jgi:D-glutamate cyclase